MNNHITPANEAGSGLISTLLFAVIGLLLDSPVWLKNTLLVLSCLVAVATLVDKIRGWAKEYRETKKK